MIKPIPGFEHYFADELGNIYSNKSKYFGDPAIMHRLRTTLAGKNGFNYRHVCLCVNNHKYSRKISTLVLSAFVSPRPRGMWALHGVNGRFDDSLNNLSWGTPSKNHSEDRIRDGTMRWGEKNNKATLNEIQIKIIRRFHSMSSDDQTKKYLSEIFNTSRRNINDIVLRNTWSHVK